MPDYPLAQLGSAEAQFKTGQHRRAAGLYQGVLERAEDSSTVFDHAALQGLARAQKVQGDAAGAEATWERAELILRQDAYGNAFGHRRELARLLLERARTQDIGEALELLSSEVRARRDALALELYGWALAKAGRTAEAEDVLEEALAQGLQDAGLYHRAGLLALSLGETERAERLSAEAYRIDPTFDAELWRTLNP